MKKRVLKIAALLMAAVGFAPQAQADTELLKQEKGYTKITQMPADENLDDYYFIFVDKNKDLMITLGVGNRQGDHKTWYYRTSVDPITDLNRVWTVESGNGLEGYSFRNVNEPTYLMETKSGSPWDFYIQSSTTPTQTTSFKFAYDATGSYWMFENGTAAGNYIGTWDEGEDTFIDGAGPAANKTGKYVGHFVIYQIPKTDFNALYKTYISQKITDTYSSILTNSEAEQKAKEVYEAAINTAKDAINKAPDLATMVTNMATLETARQTYVLIATPINGASFDYTFLIEEACNSTTGWTKTYGPVASGAQDNYQLQRSGNKNNNGLFSYSYIETWTNGTYNAGQLYYTATNLPAGHYKISAYTFDSSKSGAVNFFVNDADHSTQLDNSTDLFSLSTVPDVMVAPNAQALIGLEIKEAGKTNWVGLTHIQLEYLSPLTDEETLPLAKESLATLLEEATAKDITANVGKNAFQIPQALADAVAEAITDGTAISQKADATLKEVNAAIEALNDAVAAFNAATLNAPAAGDRFNVILATQDNYQYKNMAITFVGGRSDGQGNYSLNYHAPRNANYAQAFTFEKVEGKANQYLMSFVNENGKTVYVCTGTVYGAGTGDYGIRTTEDKEKALAFEVIATSVDGVYHLRNTVANQYMGSQDQGFYTVNSHIEYNIVKAEEAEVSLTVTEAGWATLILPFNAEVPDGLAAYTCGEAKETATEGEATLVLEEAATLAANTPYIIQGAADTYNFSGYGLATQDTYGNSFMTGTLVEKAAADQGTYVLQNQDGKVGFYLVGDVQPKVGAYRAYLNAEAAPAGSNVQAFILKGIDGDGTTTGIDGTVAEADATVNVYNLNGILVRQNVKMSEALDGLQKGIYIVNGTKKAVK